MKIIAILFVAALLLSACQSKPEKKDNGLEEVRLDDKTANADIIRLPVSADKPLDTANLPKCQFEQSQFEFGTVNAGTVIKHGFTFKNTGKSPLLITDIRTTCGCTVPDWNRKPIPPGASDVVNVTFDTTDKINEQEKKITVVANTVPSETELILRGVVINKTGKVNE